MDSFKETVEDAGVPWFELAGEEPWAGELAAGADDDPESFFFEDLFESFARDKTLCLNPFIVAGYPLSAYTGKELSQNRALRSQSRDRE